MRLIVIGFMVSLLGSSCAKKVPNGVVPQRQMTALLLDMHMADGQLASMAVDSARIYRDAYYQAIFDRYGLDSTAFEQNIAFYSSRPSMLDKVYVAIEKELEAMNLAEQKAIEAEYAAQRRADSINNAKRTDSLRRVARDSLDLKRKRYLLYLDAPDSVYGKPVPITHVALRERMLEAVGLDGVPSADSAPPPPAQVPLPPEPIAEPRERPKSILTPTDRIK